MDATKEFVLDGSVTMVWGFDDEADDYADAILERMPELQAHVPSLWPLEVANALLVGERRHRITPAETSRFLAILGTFPIVLDNETASQAWAEYHAPGPCSQPLSQRCRLPRVSFASRSAARNT